LRKDHGFNFEVPASAQVGATRPIPLKAMGRLVHEAVAVDPHSGIVYQTEDRGDGLIYRFIPDEPGKLAEGGRLQGLRAKDRHSLDTRNWEHSAVERGQIMPVEWIDVQNVESPQDDLRLQGFSRGAARFARGEGMWYSDRTIYFVCTNGGSTQKGQVWRYRPSPHEGRPEEQRHPGTLELFIQPDDPGLVENADNVTATPWGDLILCEDGPDAQYLVGVTPQGQLYKLGHNALSTSEFAGATFSPDGTTLFVNIQGAGMSLAIQGPWKTAPGASTG
jgi:secreted PhoX family phosphatase